MTIQEELEARGGCRYGLNGVLVSVDDLEGPLLVVRGSHWDRHRNLLVTLGSGDFPREASSGVTDDGSETATFADVARHLARQKEQERWQEVDANRCHLRSEWPVVCCEPRYKRTKGRK